MTTLKSLPADLIDSLLGDYKKPEDLIGEHGLLKQLTKALVERALQVEIAEHLGHDKHETITNPTGNARNGKSRKTLKGEFGELPLSRSRVTVKAVSSRESFPSISNPLDGFL